jgi:hypothetical protein
MSLVQRVTSIEGTDREQPPHLDSIFAGYGTPAFHGTPGYGTINGTPTYSLRHKPSQQRSLRHVISYDAFPKPEEPSQATNPTGGVTAYKVSTAQRVGRHIPNPRCAWLSLYVYSAGDFHGSGVLACLRTCIWLRSPQAGADRSRRIPRALHCGGASRRRGSLLRAGVEVRLLCISDLPYADTDMIIE